MKHINKNKLVDYIDNEIIPKNKLEVREHLLNCLECRNYLEDIKRVEERLSIIKDEKPSNDVLENIMSDISGSLVQRPQKNKIDLLSPILQIAFGILFLFSLIYIVNSKIITAEYWNYLEKSWFVSSFGSYGVAILIILLIGTFITLAFAPILLMESNKNNIKNYN